MNNSDLDFRAFLEAAPEGIAVVDEDGRIVVVNEQLCRLFDYATHELSGLHVEVLIPERFRFGHLEHRASYDADPSRRPMGLGLDLVGLRRDGSEFPVEISLSPILSCGRRLTIAVVRDISDRDRLKSERDAMRTVLDTEQERYRIGMDLHDGIMQDIYATTLSLDMAYEDIDEEPGRARLSIARSIDQLQAVIRDIRSYIFDLRPRQFTGNLAQALADLGREFQENSSIETVVEVPPELPEIDHTIGVALYIIAHEALSNTRKYAQATRVNISLGHSDGAVLLSVRDNGRGFNATTELSEDHRGLKNMASRAGGIGAELVLESTPGNGSAIHVKVGVSQSAQDR